MAGFFLWKKQLKTFILCCIERGITHLLFQLMLAKEGGFEKYSFRYAHLIFLKWSNEYST
jgi:hypothetical protein